MRRPVLQYFFLGLFLMLTAMPLLLGLGYALLYSLGLAGLTSEGFTLTHWASVLEATVFWRSLFFSFYVALASIGLALIASLSVVLSWQSDLRRGGLSYLIYAPLTLPAVVVAFFIFQLLSGGGFASRFLYRLNLIIGIEAFPDLVNDPFGIGIITAHLLMATPFFIILFNNLYESESLASYRQVALTLGATPVQVTRRVFLPVLLRRASATLILYFIFVMSSYEIPLLLGSQATPMVSVLTIQKLQRFNLLDIPQAYVISVIYSAMVIGLLVWSLGKKERPERIT